MNNFDIISLDDKNVKILVVMKTKDSPFDFADELQDALKLEGFSGQFVIDELLHSGNNEERFICVFFDGDLFDESKLGFEGIGKPEPLKYDLAGKWSRRITDGHKLIYQVEGNNLIVYTCRYHY